MNDMLGVQIMQAMSDLRTEGPNCRFFEESLFLFMPLNDCQEITCLSVFHNDTQIPTLDNFLYLWWDNNWWGRRWWRLNDFWIVSRVDMLQGGFSLKTTRSERFDNFTLPWKFAFPCRLYRGLCHCSSKPSTTAGLHHLWHVKVLLLLLLLWSECGFHRRHCHWSHVVVLHPHIRLAEGTTTYVGLPERHAHVSLAQSGTKAYRAHSRLNRRHG